MRLGLLALPFVILPLLAGCKSVPAVAGAASGAATGAVTGNPGVAIAVGVLVQAVVDEAVKRWGRIRQGAEQDEIAATAGALPVGGSAPWQIAHTVPVGDEHGDLTVLRDIETPLVNCREILFTVREDQQAHPFVTRLCKQDDHWKWADAEPAVPRWGFLQ